ncbi:DUF2513 domain-containing protein [Veillonella sp. T11011-6]|uniref:DUF2513 domain-containing protein n=1 Tax=Veillonella sp. T11011-6 TaxID=2027459 RepID=UPI000CF3BC04|nr:DUF2513 domain-containing protein [Veillonella sp. T11011-6]PQL09583.1 hypothetical protein VRHSUH10_08415 [Veillonella sp. T11011-6]
MKRDFDLIRNILLQIEASTSTNLTIGNFIELAPENILAYHIHLIYEAGFIEAYDITCIGNNYPMYQIQWLTNAGHDYLDAVRNDNIWKDTKDNLLKIGGSASLEVIKTIASNIALKIIGL